MARDLIAIMTGLEPGSVDLDVRIQLPDSVRAHLSEVERARDAEAQARSHAANELRAAATQLKSAGLSVRELGAVLGISYQRASQLTNSAGLPAEPPRQLTASTGTGHSQPPFRTRAKTTTPAVARPGAGVTSYEFVRPRELRLHARASLTTTVNATPVFPRATGWA